MSKRENQRIVPHPGRLCAAAAGALCLLLLAAILIPWHFPYDRLDHLYGVENYETIECGYPGGEFILMCSPISGSPRMELMVNGKVYCPAAFMGSGRYSVTLGSELFAKPGELELTLRETFRLPISLRSNTIRLYVTE